MIMLLTSHYFDSLTVACCLSDLLLLLIHLLNTRNIPLL